MKTKIIFLNLLMVQASIYAQLKNSFTLETYKSAVNYYDIVTSANNFYQINPDAEEAGGENQFTRWQWFWQSRVDTRTPVERGRFSNSVGHLLSILQTPVCTSSAINPNWRCLGPGMTPMSDQNLGIICSVSYDPTDPLNRMFVGTTNAGLWKTVNGGQQWTCITDVLKLPGLGIQDIAINPLKPDVIYIATGVSRWGSYGIGVLKSNDGGMIWESTGLTFTPNGNANTVINKIIIDPVDTNIIYAIGGQDVYKSVNRGVDWLNPNQPLCPSPCPLFSIPLSTCEDPYSCTRISRTIIDMEMKPNDQNTLFISTNDLPGSVTACCTVDCHSPGCTTGQTNGGSEIWKTTDAGISWTELTGVTNSSSTLKISNPALDISERIGMAVTESEPNSLYLIYRSGSSTFFHKSTDAGATWNSPQPLTNVTYFEHAPGLDINKMEIVVSQINPDLIYLGGMEVFKSSDGGNSWVQTSDYWSYNHSFGYGHGDIRALEVYKFSGQDILYSGNDGGMARSVNNGTSWNNCTQALPVTQFFGLAGSELDAGLIVAGAQDNGVFVYQNNAWTYVWPSTAGDAYDCAIDNNDPNYRLAEKNNGTINLLHYNSSSWNSVSNPASPVSSYRPLLVNPTNNKAYIGYNNVWQSSLNALSWQQKSAFQTHFSVPVSSALYTIEVAANDPNIIYAGYGGQCWCQNPQLLFKSINGGGLAATDWIDITPNIFTSLPNAAIFKSLPLNSIAVNPDNNDEVWLAVAGFSSTERVLHSTDGGLTWSDYSDNLPAFPATKIICVKGSNADLFLGTDVGVFYTNASIYPSQGWQCFGSDFPTTVVTDMEVNYCAQKLRVSTYGRGIWEADLISTSNAEHITSNSTWSNRDLTTDLVIDPNVTLTITGIVNIATGKKITVEQGATLNLDGGTLTNRCGLMWQGIEVVGDKTQSQLTSGAQGKVSIYNGATISNARNAITLWDGDWNHTGGIVQAVNSHFLNNRRSIEFMAYHNFIPFNHHSLGNRSSFTNCDFIVDDNYPDPNYPFMAHITMWDVEGIWISNCSFENNSTNVSSSSQLGTGIGTADASFYVTARCDISPPPNFDCPVPNTHRCFFKGLEYGIYAATASTNKPVYIDKADFTDNINGIFLSSINNATITRCNLTYGANSTPMILPIQGGLTIHSGTGYRVEENKFTSDASGGSGIYTIGAYVHNTGPDNNAIYKNWFTDLTLGNVAQGKNRDNNITPSGLQYLCNTNTNIGYRDFGITRNHPNQVDDGICLTQGDLAQSAGNIFSQLGNQPDGDFGNFSSWPSIYYHTGSSTLPIYYTPSLIIPTLSNNANTCPSHFNYSGSYPLSSVAQQNLSAHFDSKQLSYLNLLYNLNQLIDGGDQNALLSEIELSWSADAWTLRNELLKMSPYLSEEILRHVAVENLLPEAMFLEVCLANPDAVRNAEFIDFLKREVNPPISNPTLYIIQSSWDTKTLRTNLEGSIVKLGHELQFINSVFLNHYHEFANENEDPIALSEYWNSRLNTVNSNYALAEIKFSIGDYETGLEILNSIPEMFTLQESAKHEWERYKEYFTFRQNIVKSKSLLELDNQEIDYLREFALNSEDIPGVMAENLLCFGYGLCNDHIPPLEGGNLRIASSAKIQDANFTFSITPTPANSYASISYTIEKTSAAQIVFYDILGTLIEKISLPGTSGIKIWDTRRLKTGLYFYTLEVDGSVVKSGKLDIAH